MVPNPNPVFLRLSDGRVLGVPAEGKAGTGTAMFGPGTPTGKATTKPVTPVKPVVSPVTPVKPPAGHHQAAHEYDDQAADRHQRKPPATTKKPATRGHTTTGG